MMPLTPKYFPISVIVTTLIFSSVFPPASDTEQDAKLEKERAEIVAKYDKVCEQDKLTTLNLRVGTSGH